LVERGIKTSLALISGQGRKSFCEPKQGLVERGIKTSLALISGQGRNSSVSRKRGEMDRCTQATWHPPPPDNTVPPGDEFPCLKGHCNL
jgi:hypothetical protein